MGGSRIAVGYGSRERDAVPRGKTESAAWFREFRDSRDIWVPSAKLVQQEPHSPLSEIFERSREAGGSFPERAAMR